MNKPFTKANAPSVTVVIPVFNGMSTLPACLDSLEAQDYPIPFEVIIVDDGSSDGSGDYAESRGIKVIRQENRGPGLARNAGVEAAEGEYLVFTDDDCILDTNFISEIVRSLPGTDVIGSQGQIYSRQKSLVARFIHHELGERYVLLNKNEYIDWVATYAACYRKDVFEEIGGFNDTYSSEDCELSFRLAQKGHKMIFAPRARSQHKNFENYFKFFRFKYKRAYWSIWLYKNFPARIVNDRLTPSSRKIMMLFMGLSAASFASAALWRPAIYPGLAFAGAMLILTLPLTVKILKKDFVLGLFTPFFLITRTVSYIFGVSRGLFDYWQGKRTVKKSASK